MRSGPSSPTARSPRAHKQRGSQKHSPEELPSSPYWDSARTATRSRHPAPGTNTATLPADPHRTPTRPSIPNSKQRDASSTRIPRPECWTRCLKHSSTATKNSSRHRPRRNEPAASAGVPVSASEHAHALEASQHLAPTLKLSPRQNPRHTGNPLTGLGPRRSATALTLSGRSR